jgi:hypothetical protein
MNQPFKFAKGPRSDIKSLLRHCKYKFPPEAIEIFIDGAEFDVDEWQFLWPPISSDDLVKGRDRLKNIERKIQELVYEVSNLPLGWRQPLWVKLGWITEPDGNSKRSATNVEDGVSFLRDLNAAINDQLDEGFFAGGRDNARKRHLVRALARRFEEVLQKRPSAAPDGPFMVVLGVVADVIDLPMGKDVVGTLLKEMREESAEE